MIHNRMEKRLRFENLEPKRMLAADLTAAVIDGDLVITGDAEPNSFLLRDGYLFGEQFQVVLLGEPNDTINGQLVPQMEFSGVTGDVIINTGGGDDWVDVLDLTGGLTLTTLSFPGDLRIDLGDGEDKLTMGSIRNEFDQISGQTPIQVVDDFMLSGGAGDDYFELTALTVFDDFTIYDTQGSNELNLLPTYFFPNPVDTSVFEGYEALTVGDDLTVISGGGEDVIGLLQASVGDNLAIITDGGYNTVGIVDSQVGGSTFVNLGDGDGDEAQIEFSDVGQTLTIVGTGTNDIYLDSVITDSLIAVVTGNSNDQVVILNSSTDLALISTGNGEDLVAIQDSAFELLLVELGQGDDSLFIGGVEVSRLALINGGRGTDTYNDLGGNDINWELDLGFEFYEDLTL